MEHTRVPTELVIARGRFSTLVAGLMENGDQQPGETDLGFYGRRFLLSLTIAQGWLELGEVAECAAWLVSAHKWRILLLQDRVCPITGKRKCRDRFCELHYQDAPIRFAPHGGCNWEGCFECFPPNTIRPVPFYPTDQTPEF